MPNLFPQLAQRMFNTPLALHPRKAEVALAALAERLGIVQLNGVRIGAFDDDEFGFSEEARPVAAGYDIVGGAALIQVEGIMVQKTGSLRPYSGMTGMDGLRVNLLAALEDPTVAAIVFDVNSPGGEIAGLFELVDTVHAARGIKPMHAICADIAYSAAYALASACDRITVPRMGGVGSIGVIAMLVDYSRAITASGLSVHFVHYGDQKALLTRQAATGVKPELLERLQQDIDAAGALFVETVARNRGMSTAAVRAQQADYFLGELGVTAGLADAVAAPDEAFFALLADLGAA